MLEHINTRGKAMADKFMQVATKVAESAQRRGFRAFIVGGMVRDTILKKTSKDVDMEVFGPATFEEMMAWLVEDFGRVDDRGKKFAIAVIEIDGIQVECALPRIESGKGHRGAIVHADGRMDMRVACARRETTVAAMAFDPLTGEIVDFFGGQADLAAGIMRHASQQFSEDGAIRTLRLMQKAGRFGWSLAPETAELCQAAMNMLFGEGKDLIWGEWLKWAEKSLTPSKGIQVLLDAKWDWIVPAIGTAVLAEIDAAEPTVTARFVALLKHATKDEREQFFRVMGFPRSMVFKIEKELTPERLVEGRDLMEWVAPGPRLGNWVRSCHAAQIEHGLTEKAQVMAWAESRGLKG
jgi:tRNA nucleotidyltransferase/poly(A) polymerase